MMKKIQLIIIYLILTSSLQKGQSLFTQNRVLNNDIDDIKFVSFNDVDADGNMDVAIVDYKTLCLFFNVELDGSYGKKQIIVQDSFYIKNILLTDIDGDNDADILFSAEPYGDSFLAWFENTDGKGDFSIKKMISVDIDKPESIAVADIDGDSIPDLLSVSSDDNKIAWYKNDGKGNFGKQKVISTAQNEPVSMFTEDFDGDGDVDIAVSSEGDKSIAWYENADGKGSFSESKIISSGYNAPVEIKAADIDGDYDIDIVACIDDDDKIIWFENTDSKGTFSEHTIHSDGYSTAYSVFIDDLDNDGDNDILATLYSAKQVNIYYNTDGKGTFKKVTVAEMLNPEFALTADINANGNKDIITGRYNELYFVKNITLQIEADVDIYNVCPSSDINLTLTIENPENYFYYWRTSEDLTWYSNIKDNDSYSGSNTNNLKIKGLTAENNGNYFLCTTGVDEDFFDKGTVFVQIFVRDTTAPVVSCINDTTIQLAEGDKSYMITGTQFDPIVSDNCNEVIIDNDLSYSPSLQGQELLPGENTIQWMIKDESYNIVTCESKIIILGDKSSITKNKNEFVHVAPNPIKDMIFCSGNNTIIENISLIDIFGRIVFNKVIEAPSTNINVSHLKNGIYMIHVKTHEGSRVLKIIKE